jgi:hypothetical protein
VPLQGWFSMHPNCIVRKLDKQTLENSDDSFKKIRFARTAGTIFYFDKANRRK